MHVFLFLKSSDLVTTGQLPGGPSGPRGSLWLLGGLIFLAVAGLLLSKFDWWWIPGVVEIVLSSPKGFTEEVVTAEGIADRPGPVRGWLDSVGVVGRERTHTVYLEQAGKLRLNPDQDNPMTATARKYININTPAFLWTVDTKLASVVTVVGRDLFRDGNGEIGIKLAALLPVVNAESNAKMDESALQRFLAEMGWYPSAALSPYVTWEKIDPTRARATMKYAGTTGSVEFHFDQDKNLEKVSAMRYKETGPDAERVEWLERLKARRRLRG